MNEIHHELPESMKTSFYEGWAHGYSQLPNHFLIAKDISLSQYKILMYLFSFDNMNKRHYTSRNQLCERLSIARDTVSKDLAYLAEKEYIVPRSKGNFTHYKVNIGINININTL